MLKHFFWLSTFLLTFITAIGQARRGANESYIIIKGGINFANVSVTDKGSVDKANTYQSFHLGIAWDLPIASSLSVQFGLFYTGKGIKTEGEADGLKYKSTVNPNYAELPINLVGKIRVTRGARLYVGAGPYAAVAIGGTNKLEVGTGANIISSNKDIKYDDDPFDSPGEAFGYPRLKRMDYGVNILGGIEVSKLLLGVNYGFGFTKIRAGTDSKINDEGKNRVWSLSVGFKF